MKQIDGSYNVWCFRFGPVYVTSKETHKRVFFGPEFRSTPNAYLFLFGYWAVIVDKQKAKFK